MNEKITVLVPVYNMGKYLRTCFDSILAQTYKNFELLAIDDGSTDDSPTICDEYANKDERVRVIHTKNQGQDMARNTGLDNTHTDYIAMVDADDCVNCHFLEILADAMEKTGADMVYGYTKNFETDDEIDFNEKIDIIDENIVCVGAKDMIVRFCKDYDPGIAVPHKLYKIKVFDGVRYPPVRVNIDEWTIHHLLLNCEKVAYVTSRIYYYRQSPEGMTRNFSLKKISGVLALLDRIKTLGAAGYDELLPSLYIRFFEGAEKFYGNCRKHGLKTQKKFRDLKPEFRKAYKMGVSTQTDTYDRKQMFAKKMFGYSFALYRLLWKLFK